MVMTNMNHFDEERTEHEQTKRDILWKIQQQKQYLEYIHTAYKKLDERQRKPVKAGRQASRQNLNSLNNRKK